MKSLILSTVQYAWLICLSIVGQQSAAQTARPGAPGIVNFPRIEYQAGTQNWAIAQNESGFISFGNNKGLLIYDGAQWQLFPMPNHTIVRSIASAGGNLLYVGAQREFGFFAPGSRGEMVYQSMVHHLKPEYREFEDVWKVFVRNDTVLFCTERGVFEWNGSAMKVILPLSGRFENFFECEGEYIFQDRTLGLFTYSESQLSAMEGAKVPGNDRVVSILQKGNNALILVTASLGMFLLEDGIVQPWTCQVSDFAKTHQAYCAIKLNDGGIALGTPLNGLALARTDGTIYLDVNRNNGLQNNTVLNLYQDAQHNLWMGLDNGLSFAPLSTQFTYIGTESGIRGTGYAAIMHQGRFYMGTNQGLYSAPWKGDVFEQFSFEPVANGIGQVWNIDLLSTGVVVSKHRGAFAIENNALVPISDIQGSWKFIELQSLPGYALQGTYNGLVLYRKDKSIPGNWRFVQALDGFNESARVFEEDGEGFIWVTHAYKGLFRISLTKQVNILQPENITIEQIKTYGPEQGLPVELFINVARIRNEIVFTTPVGIYRYNRLADRFEKHADYHEIFGDNRNIHRLLEDEAGNIWFAIDNDFGVLGLKGRAQNIILEPTYFNQLHELLVDGFEHVYAIAPNRIFIGTESGFVYIDTEKESNLSFPFGMVIKTVSLTSGTDSLLYMGYDNSLLDITSEFNHKLNDFRFGYTAPYFVGNGQILYRYKLEGFDTDWSEWSPRNEKEYTNLPYGSYAFAVQARNSYAQLSDIATYSFRILPPWWATIYAQIAYFILALLTLMAITTVVSRREKKKTDAFKREQTEKLNQKEAEFKKEVEKSESEVIALKNEKLQADINHKTSQLASTTMHLVQKTEMLQKLKEDLNKLGSDAPPEMRRKVSQISRAIDSDMLLDNNWEQFEHYFDQVHENYFKRLRQSFPELTPKDQKLCAYLRMNLSTKEIAPLLNISVRGVEISRYRLRKKLGIDSDTNLVEFIMDV